MNRFFVSAVLLLGSLLPGRGEDADALMALLQGGNYDEVIAKTDSIEVGDPLLRLRAAALQRRGEQYFFDAKIAESIADFDAFLAIVPEQERIGSDDLNACFSSLSFFDAAGMRFHLPAFIIADLRGEYRIGMEFTLTQTDAHSQGQFARLSPEQRQVVREYLLFLRERPDSEFHIHDIDRALAVYWKEA